jgi:hypothetical protein
MAVHAMISAYPRSPDEAARTLRLRKGTAAREKDPGSTFGPGSVPLATGSGSVSVVYWVPGPLPRPIPAQPACEPGAGLGSNLPLIPPMSTVAPLPLPVRPRLSLLSGAREFFSGGRKICRCCPLACHAFGVWITALGVT